MLATIQKWGNSLGIRIPKKIANDLNLNYGSKIELDVKNNHLLIIKSDSELDLLLDQVNESNCHHEIFKDDNKKGNETW